MYPLSDTTFMGNLMLQVIRYINKFPYGIPFKNVVTHFSFSDIDQFKGKSYMSIYIKLYRLLIKASPFIIVYKMDGLLFLRPATAGLDLIKDYAKFKLYFPDSTDMPKNAGYLRQKSIFRLQNVKISDKDLKLELIENFNDYIDSIKDKHICFYRFAPKMVPSPTLIIPYSTRFNDKKKIQTTLESFETAVNLATNEYKKAVFLTLTTDPKRFSSLWEANRNFSSAWNQFLSQLTKKLGHRPRYIVSFEYTKITGLLHCHAIIFGNSYLLPKRQISNYWNLTGQGEITWIYGIHNSMGRWHWNKKKPRNAGKKDAIDYLKKYLKKNLFGNEDLELFWTFNKRFWSCSRKFKILKLPPLPRIILWKFIGSYHLYDIPDTIYLFSNYANYFMEVEPG